MKKERQQNFALKVHQVEVGKMDLQAILNMYNKYEEWYVKLMLR